MYAKDWLVTIHLLGGAQELLLSAERDALLAEKDLLRKEVESVKVSLCLATSDVERLGKDCQTLRFLSCSFSLQPSLTNFRLLETRRRCLKWCV